MTTQNKKGLLRDSDNGSLSSKRVMAFISFGMMIAAGIGDLVWDMEIDQFIYDSWMILTLGGLGLTTSEKFSK